MEESRSLENVASDLKGQLRAGIRIDSQLSESDELSLFFDYFDLDREAARGIASQPFFVTERFADEHFNQRVGTLCSSTGINLRAV